MSGDFQLTNRVSTALQSIDRQAPFLNYMGLAFWMAWNTLAFSGSFWLHDMTDASIAENLVLTHLIACVVVLISAALFKDQAKKFIAKNWLTLAGGFIAAVGATLIIFARVGGDASKIVFNIACVFTGGGTTLLFLRSAPLYGALPPRRALCMLASCTLFSAALFFIIKGTPEQAHDAIFIVLPILSALTFCIRAHDVEGEATVLHQNIKLGKGFGLFLASVMLCSLSFEFLTHWSAIEVPASSNIENIAMGQLVVIIGCIVILAVILLMNDRQRGYVQLYTVIVVIMTVFLLVMAVMATRNTVLSSITGAVNSMYTLVVWGMLAHIVYQTRSSALVVYGLGNAALSLGTILAAAVLLALHYLPIPDSVMQLVLVVLGLLMLLDIVFVFNERTIKSIITPIEEERLAQDVFGEDSSEKANGPGQWKLDCEAIAKAHGLTARETEVFIAVGRGKTAQQIADEDTLSVYTVRAHIRSMYSKLDVHSKKDVAELIERERAGLKM